MNRFRLAGVLAAAVLFCPTVGNAQSLVINEALSSNSSFDYDDFFQYEDWIEIYNAGGIQNLSGYYLSDDPDTLNKWMFPASNPGLTTILPGGHLRIWCDNDEQQGEDHTNFKLSSEGETVFLVEPDGSTIIDSVTLGLAQTDISYGRTCDGCPDWQYFNVPTPEAPNSDAPVPVSTLFINEYQVANENTLFDEAFNFSAWIEVFNPNDFQVNLAGYEISLNGQSHTFNNEEPWKTTIEANDFQVFWLDDNTAAGSNHVAMTPSASGTMLLIGNDGSVVDEVSIDAALAMDVSRGRSTDGSPLWTDFSTPTPRVTNALQIIAPAGVVINEAQADNFITYQDAYSESDDWIELHNPTNAAIDIAGYYLTDRLDRPQKWQVPVTTGDSTIIPAGGYVVLFADEDGSQGWNHMNFKLSSVGEPIALRSPDGFSVADSVFLPSIGQDRSWGRAFDAHPDWVEFFIPTPNATNGENAVQEAPEAEKPTMQPTMLPRGGQAAFSHAAEIFDLQGKWVMAVEPGLQSLSALPVGMYVAIWDKSQAPVAPSTRFIVLH